LAVLAKGPVGILIPAGIALTVLAFDRDVRSWKRFAPRTGPAVFVAILGVWMAWATISAHGSYSVWAAFEKHVLSRAIHGMHHKQPPWYYLTVLPVQLLPWSALVPGALLLAWKRRADPGDRFLLIHALFVCAFFSIWTEKRDLYVLPAYPAFAILLARLILAAQDAADGVTRRWVTLPLALTGALLLLASAALPIAIARAAPSLGVPWRLTSTVLAGAGISTLLAVFLRGPSVAARTLPIGMGAVYLATITWIYPPFDAIKSARAMGESLKAVAGRAHASGVPVFAYGLGNVVQGIAFYSDGVYTRVEDDPKALAVELGGDRPAYAVIDSDGFSSLPEAVRAHLEVSGRFEMSRLRVLIVSKRD
jgi:4-amino-4-deoxy-L-arabinose transferase-like glycosyltransferase